MIFILDNYDSFTWNLVQYFGEYENDIRVVRNDAITVERIRALNPEGIVISPGPKAPQDAGISMDIIRQINDIPILGVCLGHQSIGAALGGEIIHAPQIVHGKSSKILRTQNPESKMDLLFREIPDSFNAVRYHSLVINPQTLPEDISVLATTEDNIIMAIKVKSAPVWGLQFHPESILTEKGKKFIENFYSITRIFRK